MHHIIRLKRYEQPPQEYFDKFLRDFNYRQRAELMKPSLSTLLIDRLYSFMAEFRVPAMAYAGATLIAIVTGVAILKQTPQPQSRVAQTATLTDAPRSFAASSSSSSYSQPPVTIDRVQPVSLRIDTPSTTSVAFPPTYLLQAPQASHESPLSF